MSLASRINPTAVDAVLSALKIEVKLRRGRRAWALCPFHVGDTSPKNFFIRISGPRLGQCWCFACENGGTLPELVMHVRGCDYESAKAFIELLGSGFEAPKLPARVRRQQPILGRVRFIMPREVYFEPLTQWVTPARRYAESRGITHEEVERYGMGYAVDGRLGGRIVLPWRGSDGLPYGYSARTFTDQDPKYQTPHSTENPDRGVMFGEHLWPKADGRQILFITEGALNALAIARVYPEVSVAALGGSHVDPLHAIKFSTFQSLYVLTDPDEAGDKAAAMVTTMLGRYAAPKRIRLPEGQDALDVGPKKLKRYLDRGMRVT